MNLKFICITISLFIGIQTINAQNKGSIEIGKINAIQSNILSEEREYWISLPASYDDKLKSYKKYPIVIVLDGNMHFKSSVGIIQFMGGERNGYRQLPEMIVVGIMNVNRRRDFTPDKVITKRKNDTGGGDKFLAFLEQELIPKIDKDYRTIPYRMLIGHSLGGLLTAHAYLQENSAFNAFISIDPSFGTWTDRIMDEKVALVNEKVFTRPIYMATANWDKRNIRNRDRHVRFYESLNSKCKDKYRGKIEYFENENHGTVPLPAFYNGISFIFKDYYYPYRSATNREELVNHFKAISQRLSYKFLPPEELVNSIGYNKLRSRNEDEKKMALAFFKLNVENYPESYNVYDSLGEVELEFGFKEKARKNFEKSLVLNPNNENAKNMIAKIKNK